MKWFYKQIRNHTFQYLYGANNGVIIALVMRNASKHAVWQNLLFIYIVWHNVWVRDCVSSSIATAVDIVVKTECPQNLSKQMRIDIEIQTVSKIVNGPASMSLNGDFFYSFYSVSDCSSENSNLSKKKNQNKTKQMKIEYF